MSFAKLEHTYEVTRQETLIAKGKSVLACLDRRVKSKDFRKSCSTRRRRPKVMSDPALQTRQTSAIIAFSSS